MDELFEDAAGAGAEVGAGVGAGAAKESALAAQEWAWPARAALAQRLGAAQRVARRAAAAANVAANEPQPLWRKVTRPRQRGERAVQLRGGLAGSEQ